MNDDVRMPVDGDDPGRLPPGPPGMPGCPKGPWRSRYEARDSFREYGKSGKFFHGSFDVKLVGLKRYSKSASTRLLCRRAGQPGRGAEPAVERRRTTKKCDCKWAVSLKARKLPEGEIFPTTTAPSAKMGSRDGSSGGQRRYKSRVEMSKMQKGKGQATD